MKKIIVAAPLSLFVAVSVGFAHGERPSATKAMPNARAAFDEVVQLIGEKYVDPAPNEDELWTGAINGVLGRLIQTKGIKVNALLEPEELKELDSGLSGNFVGVGVAIKKFEGVVFVRNVIPESPASKAGLLPGDRILAVDHKPIRDLSLEQIVGLIRGAEGTTVDLSVQRDEKDWVEPITRRSMKLDSVFAHMLADKTGYVRITAFNHNTVEQLDAALTNKLAGAASLVLDLRDCPGGLFDESLVVAERFLPPGAAILKMRGRDGKEDVRRASKRDPGDALPMVVIINHDTASSAEILAAALVDNKRARLVGETTLGKGSVEHVMKLSNGWGLKLSIARFVSPSGRNWQGKGLDPDLPIARKSAGPDDDVPSPYSEPEVDSDVQLRAALTLLNLRTK
jgi:carboxyl-terminal processing protease